jgi:CRP-like cAMP-binding protein
MAVNAPVIRKYFLLTGIQRNKTIKKGFYMSRMVCKQQCYGIPHTVMVYSFQSTYLKVKDCVPRGVCRRTSEEESGRLPIPVMPGQELKMKYYSRVIKKFKNGDIIFSENSQCDGMYIIDSGRVRVFKTVGQGAARREIDLCTLGPKAMFGEMAMIDENKRSASVQAIEPTVCTVISKKVFEDQLARIPVWMVNMIKILVLRLRESNERLRTIVELYTPPPVDSGSVLTIDEDHANALPGHSSEAQIAGKVPFNAGMQLRSDEIVKELFDPAAAQNGA